MPTTLYEKVIAVIGMLRSSIDQKTSKLDLAPLFNTSVNYPVDSLVVYKNVLYVCTTAHSGEWDANDFATATIDDILRLKANKSEFAPEYSDSDTYAQYQLVIKGGKFMQCMSAGTGPGAVFTDITVAQVVERLDQAIKQAASIDAVYAVVENIAPKYEVFKSYKVGDRCSYNGVVYECTTAVQGESENPDSSFWSTYWSKKTVDAMLRSLKNEISNGYVQKDSDATLASLAMRDTSTGYGGPTLVIGGSDRSVIVMKDRMLVVAPNDPSAPADGYVIHFPATKSGTMALLQDLAPSLESLQPTEGILTFKAGQMVTYNHRLYLCTSGYNVNLYGEDPLFNPDYWTECTIEAVLNAILDSISELANSGLSYALVNTQGFLAKESTMNLVSTSQYAPVGRIFIEPGKFNLSAFGSVLTKLTVVYDRGNYDSFYFNPSYVGMTNGQFLNGVTLYLATAQGGTDHAQQGDTVIAKLHKIDGESDSIVAQSDEITWPAAPANNTDESESPVAANFKFSSDNQIADASLMYYVTFHRKNGETFEDTKIRIRAVAATRQNTLLYLGSNKHLTLCNISFSDCASGDSCNVKVFSIADQESVYMHLCKLPSGSSRGRFADGEVVAASNATTISSGEKKFGLAQSPELDTTACYFFAFDRTKHSVGDLFSGGVCLLMDLLPTSYTFDGMGLSCDGDAYVPSIVVTGDYKRNDSHVPVVVYRDTFSPGLLPLPDNDVEMEVRYVILGEAGNTIGVSDTKNEIVPLNGDSSWATLPAGSRYVYVFKSLGKTIGETATSDSSHTIGFKRLWTVERYSA